MMLKQKLGQFLEILRWLLELVLTQSDFCFQYHFMMWKVLLNIGSSVMEEQPVTLMKFQKCQVFNMSGRLIAG